MAVPAATELSPPSRLRITRLIEGPVRSTLAADVVRGFGRVPRALPPKYFYDERGAELFDAICDTPEYYPTRTEQALLERVAPEVMAESRPTHLVELGSGAARKTRVLLDAMGGGCYVPVDISERMLLASARGLLADYSDLTVHAVVADYDHHLSLLPREGRRLIAFLGSTIGNFSQPASLRFLRDIAGGMGQDDRMLIGFDLVKAPAVLDAAYNDAAGITAEFNRNVLRVINRELDGDFDLDRFVHVARYVPEQKQVEMLLECRGGQRVHLGALGRSYQFADGERVRTEISRKYDRARVETIAGGAGLETVAWHESPDRYFGLLVARRRPG